MGTRNPDKINQSRPKNVQAFDHFRDSNPHWIKLPLYEIAKAFYNAGYSQAESDDIDILIADDKRIEFKRAS